MVPLRHLATIHTGNQTPDKMRSQRAYSTSIMGMACPLVDAKQDVARYLDWDDTRSLRVLARALDL